MIRLALILLCLGTSVARADPLVDALQRYMGSRNPTGTRGPWCVDMLNVVLKQTGHYFMPTRRAIDYYRYPGEKLKAPQVGAIAVTHHHVTVVAEVLNDHEFIGRGGNQHHIVKDSRYHTARYAFFIPR